MRNEYEIRGNDVYIYIKNKGVFIETIVSLEDLQKVEYFPNTWSVWTCNKTGNKYVLGKVYKDNKEIAYPLHRWLTNAPKGKVVDHINHDTLDNRKSNLRVLEHYQNLQNRKGVTSANRSGVRGVGFHKATGKWRARVTIKGKQIHLGSFDTLEEAEKVVKEERKKLLNFSKE